MTIIFERNDTGCVMSNKRDMDADKRRHFIPEWAERRGKKQADIVRALNVEKSAVSRWFTEGVIPTDRYLVPLAQFLAVDEVISLFHHPDDDWLAKMFRDKTEEQKEAASEMLRLFFQQNAGTVSDQSRKKVRQ